MIPGTPPPEIPPPGTPARPTPWPDQPEPAPGRAIPQVPLPTDAEDPVNRLRAGRRLLLMGTLDQPTADRLCAELMLADGLSVDPVELIINCRGGPAAAALELVDVITLRAPLATRSIGAATGTAAIVLASGTGGRSAAPNATISLRLGDSRSVEGRADDILRDADRISDLWDRIARHVAGVSSLTIDEATAALRDGGHLTPDRAAAAGLIDEIAQR